MIGTSKGTLKVSLKTILECFVLAFIVMAPSHNSLENFKIFGYSLMVVISVLIIAIGGIIALTRIPIRGKRAYFVNLILAVFALEVGIGIFRGKIPEIGLVLCMLLLVVWFDIDTRCFGLRRLYMAFYFSTIVAAIFSLIYGFAGGIINRTATKVDGSIAVICCAIICFADDEHFRTPAYKILKFLASVGLFIVAGLGMSRARIVLIVILLAIRLIQAFLMVSKSQKVRVGKLVFVSVLLTALVFLWNLPVVQSVLQQSFLRFEDGFLSTGRTEEIKIGIDVFKQNTAIGFGWSEFYYVDYLQYQSGYVGHCMYVAILARGGIVLGLAFVLFVLATLKDGIKYRKNLLLIVLIAVFLALGYGNAGLFNYTISSSLILIAWHLKNEYYLRANSVQKRGDTE